MYIIIWPNWKCTENRAKVDCCNNILHSFWSCKCLGWIMAHVNSSQARPGTVTWRNGNIRSIGIQRHYTAFLSIWTRIVHNIHHDSPHMIITTNHMKFMDGNLVVKFLWNLWECLRAVQWLFWNTNEICLVEAVGVFLLALNILSSISSINKSVYIFTFKNESI